MNNTKIFASLAIVTTIMSSCTTTIPATSKARMDATIEEVKSDLKQKGYYAAGYNSEQKTVHDYGAKKSGSGGGHEDMETNAIFNVDTYKFENSNGDKMQFSVQYMVKESRKGVFYADVSTMGYETSNVKDYESLCGTQSPVRKLDSMPKDGKAKIASPTKTFWLCLGSSLGILGVGIAIVASSL